MKMTFISFDIDGTLTKPGGGSPGLFRRAFNMLYGPIPKNFHNNNHTFGNHFLNIDSCVQIMKMNGFEPNQDAFNKLQKKCEELFSIDAQKIIDERKRINNSKNLLTKQKQNADHSVLLPGVEKSLEILNSKPNLVLGVTSSNYESIGWKKIELANLSRFFPDKIGGFGLEDNKNMALLKALEKAKKERKISHFDKLFHVGDTIGDAESALAVGFTPIIVKTGGQKTNFPKESIIFENMEDPKFVELLIQ
ncbi:hypothetical protein TRFO_38628 [Tritrichomonas foetus]|uniref:Haloacid dehalogenase-like hydrolase family protein n=1 Tax=Tritrichomonas foetus TaxID=1144522 RepID=A0A1J4JAN3_9EUKA|nr:hypothetical protein TRFO_38628 [Tritrichomonas foetus]|eukprot:OHS95287.1 hypothetical protein TRFO_38628 [Tritrichomonas foetus]